MAATEQHDHLADLHALAAKVGVPGFRLLGREDLVEQIRERGGEVAPAAPAEPKRRRRRGGQAASTEEARQGESSQEETSGEEPAQDDPGEPVTGLLDVMPQGYGFLRLHGLEAADGDVYISASQIRRCELLRGDEITGPARAPRRGERHRALVHVETVNGLDPEAATARADFDSLTPVAPHRRVRLEPDPEDVLTRAVDLLAPLALGQRVLVAASHRAGRTTLLRGMASAIAAAPEAPALVILLADERPEEATEWRRRLPDAEIAAATADQEPRDQVHLVELALARAQRRAETGADVVVILDSLTRLALGYRNPADVKPFFGAGRELEEPGAGSLTVIATALMDDDDEGDPVYDSVITTENALISLDPELAAAGIYPAIDVMATTVTGEESLREPAELEAVRKLREKLAALSSREAAEELGELLRSSPTNADLLSTL